MEKKRAMPRRQGARGELGTAGRGPAWAGAAVEKLEKARNFWKFP